MHDTGNLRLLPEGCCLRLILMSCDPQMHDETVMYLALLSHATWCCVDIRLKPMLLTSLQAVPRPQHQPASGSRAEQSSSEDKPGVSSRALPAPSSSTRQGALQASSAAGNSSPQNLLGAAQQSQETGRKATGGSQASPAGGHKSSRQVAAGGSASAAKSSSNQARFKTPSTGELTTF